MLFQYFLLLGLLSNVVCQDINCEKWKDKICIGCFHRYYLNLDGQCQMINPYCKTYTEVGICTSCHQRFILKGTDCFQSKNCIQWNWMAKCSKCIEGYFPHEKIGCAPANPLCKTINPLNGYCLSCYTNFALNEEESNCEIVLKSSEQIKIYHCALYNENGSCDICMTDYFYNSTSQQCQLRTSLCQIYNSFFKKCEKCFEGYLINIEKGTCGLIDVTNCEKMNSKMQCLQCKDRYYVHQGICKQVHRNCEQYAMLGGQCITCKNNNSLYEGSCYNSQRMSCLSRNQTSNSCVVCSCGFYPSPNNSYQCLPVSHKCKKYHKTTGQCERCHIEYILKENRCQEFKPSKLCRIYDEFNNCIQCFASSYYDDYGQCQLINAKCKTFNFKNNTCIDCRGHYQMNLQGQCE